MTAYDLIDEVYNKHRNDGEAPYKKSVLAALRDPKYFEGNERVTPELRKEAIKALDDWYQDAIENELYYIDDDKVVDWWNQFCDENGWCDDKIYPNNSESINQFFTGMDAFEVVKYLKKHELDYDFDDKYVTFKNDELESFNEVTEHIYVSDLAEWIIRNGDECDYINFSNF